MKICSKCKAEKPLSEFHKRANRPCGVRSMCKDCYKNYPTIKKRRDNYMRNYDLNKSYGISIAEYDELFKKQNGKCAICNKTSSEKGMNRKKHLCVDHCHTTGKVRGLLCDQCNRAIGLLNEDLNVLNKAINYLKEHGQIARITNIF